MARKKLLTEGEVRQFMKLANLAPLSENYFSGNSLDEVEEEELGELPGEGLPGEEFPGEELGVEDEMPLEDEEGLEGAEPNEAVLARVVQAVADELGVEVDVEAGAEEGGEEELGAELEEPLPGGEEVGLPGEEGGVPGEEDLMERAIRRALKEFRMGSPSGAPSPKRRGARTFRAGQAGSSGESELEAFGGPEFEAEFGGAELEEPAGECVPGDEECEEAALEEHDAIVAEVSRRVAARLSAAKRKDVVAEQLAERIFKRLTQK